MGCEFGPDYFHIHYFMVLLPSLPPRLLPHPERLDGAGTDGRGLCGGLETDARRTAVQSQCDIAAGTDRDTPLTGMSENKTGRCAGLQLPAPERLGQDRDAHPEILHQTVHRFAGRHAFHPERKIPDKRCERTTRKPRLAGPDRADAVRRICRWHLQGIPVRLHYRLEHPGFRAALYPESR